MSEVLLFTVLTLCIVGVLAAVVLYFVAQKFKVYEDPRIDAVESMLPGANCGGCGYPGCRGLADALVGSDDLSSLYCTAGGAETMKRIAEYLGKVAPEKEPAVAVVRCNGSCEKRPRTNIYDGAAAFGALSIDPRSGLPVVNEALCTACGACVKACPKGIIELRKKGMKGRRVYVGCVNKDKGAIARKACASACIGCGKCQKTCSFDAITLQNNLAYIDADKCRLCRKCVEECPTGAILQVNFPARPAPSGTEIKASTSAPSV